MKTVADFKRKMQVGAKVSTQLFHLINNEYMLTKDYGERIVSVSKTNSIALRTYDTEKKEYLDSWLNWPLKEEFIPLNENSAEILFEGGKLLYTFL